MPSMVKWQDPIFGQSLLPSTKINDAYLRRTPTTTPLKNAISIISCLNEKGKITYSRSQRVSRKFLTYGKNVHNPHNTLDNGQTIYVGWGHHKAINPHMIDTDFTLTQSNRLTTSNQCLPNIGTEILIFRCYFNLIVARPKRLLYDLSLCWYEWSMS